MGRQTGRETGRENERAEARSKRAASIRDVVNLHPSTTHYSTKAVHYDTQTHTQHTFTLILYPPTHPTHPSPPHPLIAGPSHLSIMYRAVFESHCSTCSATPHTRNVSPQRKSFNVIYFVAEPSCLTRPRFRRKVETWWRGRYIQSTVNSVGYIIIVLG